MKPNASVRRPLPGRRTDVIRSSHAAHKIIQEPLMKRAFFAVLAAATLAAPAFAQVSALTGAGATFPYPIYSKWFDEYHKVKPDLQINYQSIGSGGGIRQLTEKTVDFGASDGPMTDEQIAKAGGAVLHLPTVLGAVVPAFNVEGVTELKLDGPAL